MCAIACDYVGVVDWIPNIDSESVVIVYLNILSTNEFMDGIVFLQKIHVTLGVKTNAFWLSFDSIVDLSVLNKLLEVLWTNHVKFIRMPEITTIRSFNWQILNPKNIIIPS